MPVNLRGGDVPDYIGNPKMMLAELNMSKQQCSGSGAKQELHDGYDLVQMLEGVKKVPSSLKGTTVICNNNPRAMLADLDDQKQTSDIGHSEDEDDDLETLRGKLATMFALSCDTPSPEVRYTAKDTPVIGTPSTSRKDVAATIEPEYVPDPDLKEQEAKKEREEMVKRENEKLDVIIKFVLEEEARHRAIEEKKGLPTRLIVSNLAASVDEEAIHIFFAKYKCDM
jgi:hypothetical protein